MKHWKYVKTARNHGWNVRKAGDGYQIGKLSGKGYEWSPIIFATRQTALRHAYYRWEADCIDQARLQLSLAR